MLEAEVKGGAAAGAAHAPVELDPSEAGLGEAVAGAGERSRGRGSGRGGGAPLDKTAAAVLRARGQEKVENVLERRASPSAS